MADKTANTIKVLGVLVGLIMAIVSPIIAVTKVNTSNEILVNAASKTALEAKDKACAAKEIAERNSRNFEYFKGEMTATMKAQEKSLDSACRKIDTLDVKLESKVDGLEAKVDEMLKIIVRFERAE